MVGYQLLMNVLAFFHAKKKLQIYHQKLYCYHHQHHHLIDTVTIRMSWTAVISVQSLGLHSTITGTTQILLLDYSHNLCVI